MGKLPMKRKAIRIWVGGKVFATVESNPDGVLKEALAKRRGREKVWVESVYERRRCAFGKRGKR